MRVIRSFQSKLDADLAKIALDAAGVPSLVVGTGVEFEGGASGVQLNDRGLPAWNQCSVNCFRV